jgi:ATP-binding cassette, subfamily B, bacterial PglK
MISVFKKLASLLDFREKTRAFLLFFLALLGTLLEVLGIGALLPLVTMLSRPESIQETPYLNKIYEWIHPSSTNEFIIFCLAAVLAIYILKNALLFLIAYIQGRFLYSYYLRLSSHLFRVYLFNPYSFHLKRNSAEMLRNLQAVSKVIQGVLFTSIILVTEAMVVVGLFILLVYVDPLSAIMIIGGMCVFLGLFHYGVRQKLTTWGDISLFHSGKSIQLVNEGLGSIKEMKIFGRESYFIDVFRDHMKQATEAERIHHLISQSPRYYIESITITMMLGTMIFLLSTGKEIQSILVTVALFAAAAARIMPSASRCTWAMSLIRFSQPNLDTVHRDFQEAGNSPQPVEASIESVPFEFNDQIELRNVSYRYEGSESLALDNVSLVIPKNCTVGFVGASGAGKTTAVDLIIGLMKPESGQVLVDDGDIREKASSWQRQIGYIPQNIFLSDGTVKSNVALGINEDNLDEEMVWRALSLAQLDKFARGLPEGLNTMIGERGARLSGGQSQRIGIARALYHDPQVLIMDEATAALDNETERAFMEALERFSGNKTIILIAHRLTTVKNVDQIHFLQNGRLLNSGSYQTLVENCAEFEKIART